MPIRINEIVVNNDEERTQLLVDIMKLITTEVGGTCYGGNYYDEKNKVTYIAFNCKDECTNEVVMRIIITLKINEKEKQNEIIDLDVTIPNSNILEVDFLDKEKADGKECEEESEAWTIEYDSKRTFVETVNKYVLNKNINGKNKISLSAMPYGDIKFAKDIETLNEEFGFKPKVYKWQKALGMGEEPIMMGFSKDFVGSGMLIGEIVSHKTIKVKIADNYYEGIVAELATGIGKIPALLSKEYSKDIIDGYYIMTKTELKADFAIDDYCYYK